MDAKKFTRLVNHPRHISSIHNYCDRWCERCPFTMRCSVFAVGQVEDKGEFKTVHTRAGEELWMRLAAARPAADKLLVEQAEHAGVGMNKSKRFKSLNEEVDKAPLGAAAKRYLEFAHNFVRSQEALTKMTEAPEAGGISPLEAFEVIAFYHTIIMVKLSRALHWDEMDDEMQNDPEMADMPKDQDGSAKICLIAIDRSIVAWSVLAAQMETLRETALSGMLTLHRMRTGIEKRFPKARSFVRPGFDTHEFPRGKPGI